MVKNQIKVKKSDAKSKIEIQIEKGKVIFETGKKTLKEKYNHEISSRERDIFTAKFKQWDDLTFEVLYEIFTSSSYAIKFRDTHSSKTELVGSSWIPDIKYYVTKQLVPKLDYLILLLETIDDYDVVLEEKKKVEKMVKKDSNSDSHFEFEKMTLHDFVKKLKISQLITLFSFIVALIVGSFWLGYYVSSWKVDKEKFDLTVQSEKYKNQLKKYEQQDDSRKK